MARIPIDKFVELYNEFKDLVEDPTPKDINEFIRVLADLLDWMKTYVPKPIWYVFKGVPELMRGIGYMVEHPDDGVDELLEGVSRLTYRVSQMIDFMGKDPKSQFSATKKIIDALKEKNPDLAEKVEKAMTEDGESKDA